MTGAQICVELPVLLKQRSIMPDTLQRRSNCTPPGAVSTDSQIYTVRICFNGARGVSALSPCCRPARLRCCGSA